MICSNISAHKLYVSAMQQKAVSVPNNLHKHLLKLKVKCRCKPHRSLASAGITPFISAASFLSCKQRVARWIILYICSCVCACVKCHHPRHSFIHTICNKCTQATTFHSHSTTAAHDRNANFAKSSSCIGGRRGVAILAGAQTRTKRFVGGCSQCCFLSPVLPSTGSWKIYYELFASAFWDLLKEQKNKTKATTSWRTKSDAQWFLLAYFEIIRKILFIPWTRYIQFTRMFVTARRQRRRPYEIYI